MTNDKEARFEAWKEEWGLTDEAADEFTAGRDYEGEVAYKELVAELNEEYANAL